MDRYTAESLVNQVQQDCDTYEAFIQPGINGYNVVAMRLRLKRDPNCYDRDTYRSYQRNGKRGKYRSATDPYQERCHELADGTTVRIVGEPLVIETPGMWLFHKLTNPCEGEEIKTRKGRPRKL